MDKRLPKIAALMDMQSNASSARLRKVLQHERHLQQLLEQLDAHFLPRPRCEETATIADFQNEIQLRQWADQRRASVNTELAQARVSIAKAQRELAWHFARTLATEKLIDRQGDTDARIERRRNDYGE